MKGYSGKCSPPVVPKVHIGKTRVKQSASSDRLGLSVPCVGAAGPISSVTAAPRGTLAGWVHLGQRVLGCDLWHLCPVPSFATFAR